MSRKISQRVFGILLVAFSIIFMVFAAASTCAAEKDCTVILLTLPLGIFLLTSKRVWIL